MFRRNQGAPAGWFIIEHGELTKGYWGRTWKRGRTERYATYADAVAAIPHLVLSKGTKGLTFHQEWHRTYRYPRIPAGWWRARPYWYRQLRRRIRRPKGETVPGIATGGMNYTGSAVVATRRLKAAGMPVPDELIGVTNG